MLIKFIRCRVRPECRRAFGDAQRAWGALAGVEGFRGQFGGWQRGDDIEATIVGLWTDRGAYDRFMTTKHDRIVDRNRQCGTYVSSEVVLAERRMDIPGEAPDIAAAVEGAAMLRFADCRLCEGRREHFVEPQDRVWNPAMRAAGGMIGGAFCRATGQADRYLVLTLWRSEAEHDRYARECVPDLRRRAQIDIDLSGIDGGTVALVTEWTVVPSNV